MAGAGVEAEGIASPLAESRHANIRLPINTTIFPLLVLRFPQSIPRIRHLARPLYHSLFALTVVSLSVAL